MKYRLQVYLKMRFGLNDEPDWSIVSDTDRIHIWGEPGFTYDWDDQDQGTRVACTIWKISLNGQLRYEAPGERPTVHVWSEDGRTLYLPGKLDGKVIFWQKPEPATTTEAAASASAQQGQDSA